MSPDDQVPSSDAPRSTLPGPAGRGGASPRSTALRRWGPLGAILVVVAVIAALTLTGGDDTDDAETASGGSAEEGGSSTTLDPEVVAKLPVTYAAAEAAGTVDDETWPDTCDPETGKLAWPSGKPPSSHVEGPGRPVRSRKRAIAFSNGISLPSTMNGCFQSSGRRYPPARTKVSNSRFVSS